MHSTSLKHILLWLLMFSGAVCFAQTRQRLNVKSQIGNYFAAYNLGINTLEACTVEDVTADETAKQVFIYLSESFAWQTFTPETVERIYTEVRQQLPSPYNSYEIFIYVKNHLINDLVAGGSGSCQRTWEKIHHRSNAWVTPLDRCFDVAEGLEGRHLSLWASHGRVFSQREQQWQWQRPNLFCTTEDLLTQTFVVPYLMPMLENAGAIVYSPRERDWQRHEVIIDNDTPYSGGMYLEVNGQHEWCNAGVGFAPLKTTYADNENPFLDGTSRMAATQTHRSQSSSLIWIPDIPEDGHYAVYVSYTTLPTSVSDALYTVRHGGQSTRFRVNQQMGGSTWVYLGTFFFNAGNSQDNCVQLTNQSNYRGHVTADAVRFGGGMGNIARGDSLTTSGLPRCFEGARYAVQWSGAPYEVYASKQSTNDYAEDINARSAMTNYLSRGSAYVPGDSGLNVPIEMSIGLHTDAGATADGSFIGSLGIYTTDFNDGLLPAGLSRLTSRDVCDRVLSQVNTDLSSTLGRWSRRMMFDRNYSETREPLVPSMILEMLSHQNYHDLRMAHDPYFKFLMARAVYKGILRATNALHGRTEVVVQPLPVTAPSAHINAAAQQIFLRWVATEDPLEPSAMPTGFIVYHATDNGDFDNGTYVQGTSYQLDNVTMNVLHRFRITACNRGGQSMPSQEVCAYIYDNGGPTVIVIDAFDRLAGPQPIENDTLIGFDMQVDPGVPMAKMPGYAGRQLCFDKSRVGREGVGAAGYGTSELEGIILAGNSHDWSTRHARDLISATNGRINIGSCTRQAAERADFDCRGYQLMDISFGLQRADGYSLRQAKTFTPALTQAVAAFVRGSGSVLVSGAYVGSDMTSDDDRLFTRSVLKYDYAGSLPTDSLTGMTGLSTTFDIHRRPNEQSYYTPRVDCLAPVGGAFCPMVYNPVGKSAAVAYSGTDYRLFAIGFPFEGITERETRVNLLRGILQFLVP